MVRQTISKFLRQMKFMKKTRADELDKEEVDKGPVAASTDEFWVLDIPGVDSLISATAQSTATIESFSECVPMIFGRFSYNGQNADLEKALERKEEESKQREIERVAAECICDEEEMIETYLSLARKNIKKGKGQHAGSIESSGKGVNEKLEMVQSFRRPNKATSFAKPSKITKGKIIKKSGMTKSANKSVLNAKKGNSKFASVLSTMRGQFKT